MGTIKIVLRKKQNKDGTYPLAVRITKDRKTTFLYVGQNLQEKFWDETQQRVKKSHLNSNRLNNFLLKKLSEANDKLLELQTQKDDVSVKTVKRSFRSSGTKFFAQAKIYTDKLKTGGKYNQHTTDLSRINRFKEFLKGEDIAFSDITVTLLDNYKVWLESERKIKERTIINHLVSIRAVFNQAIRENNNLTKYYPFGKGKINMNSPQSLKIGLSIDEVRKLEEVALSENSYLNHSRNVWLFAFYFAGVRVSDVLKLKWSDFKNDRLYYIMAKNDKPCSVTISEKAAKIIAFYKPKKDKTNLVFPDLKDLPNLSDKYQVQRKCATVISRLNYNLKKIADIAGIDKNLSMHIARHTFGNISGDKISIQMLQKLYRHSSIKTTIGYQGNFIHKDSDEALNAVINF